MTRVGLVWLIGALLALLLGCATPEPRPPTATPTPTEVAVATWTPAAIVLAVLQSGPAPMPIPTGPMPTPAPVACAWEASPPPVQSCGGVGGCKYFLSTPPPTPTHTPTPTPGPRPGTLRCHLQVTLGALADDEVQVALDIPAGRSFSIRLVTDPRSETEVWSYQLAGPDGNRLADDWDVVAVNRSLLQVPAGRVRLVVRHSQAFKVEKRLGIAYAVSGVPEP